MRCLIVLLLIPFAAAAEMYRWVDAQGHVHYSQVRPAQAAAEKLAPAPPPAAEGGQSNLSRYAEQLDQTRASLESRRAKQDEQAQRKQASCSQARGQLKLNGDFEGRTFSVDEKGERSYWTPEQHAQVRSQLQAQIAENCRD